MHLALTITFFKKIQNILILLHIILCGNCSSKCDFQPTQNKSGEKKKWRTCEQKTKNEKKRNLILSLSSQHPAINRGIKDMIKEFMF